MIKTTSGLKHRVSTSANFISSEAMKVFLSFPLCRNSQNQNHVWVPERITKRYFRGYYVCFDGASDVAFLNQNREVL